MTNTDSIYRTMQVFTDTRRENRRIYLERKRELDAYQGSDGYQREMARAKEKREAADAAARAECQRKADVFLKAMATANGKRKLSPPTADMVQALTVLQMLKHPSLATLDQAANALSGNGLALAALTDLAREAWKDVPDVYIPNYADKATAELDGETVNKAIRDLGHRCQEIMNSSGADRVRERGADRNMRVNGAPYDPDELPQEPPYDSERDFYQRELSWINFDLFQKAVNE